MRRPSSTALAIVAKYGWFPDPSWINADLMLLVRRSYRLLGSALLWYSIWLALAATLNVFRLTGLVSASTRRAHRVAAQQQEQEKASRFAAELDALLVSEVARRIEVREEERQMDEAARASLDEEAAAEAEAQGRPRPRARPPIKR